MPKNPNRGKRGGLPGQLSDVDGEGETGHPAADQGDQLATPDDEKRGHPLHTGGWPFPYERGSVAGRKEDDAVQRG